MKTLRTCKNSLSALAAVIALALPANAAGIGSTPGSGEIAIYTQDATAGPAVVAATHNNTTNAITHDFAATNVREDSGSFTRSGTDVTLNRTGRYLAIYNSQFDSTGGTNRTEIQSFLELDGTPLANSWSQGFIRRASSQSRCVTAGAAIISATTGDVLKLRSFRTDNNGAGATRAGGQTALQLIKLDDNDMKYARLGYTATPSIPALTAAFQDLPYDDAIEVDAGEFSNAGGALTLTNGGKYLVVANTYVAGGFDRNTFAQQLTLDGTAITGSKTVVYVRGTNQQSCGDGAAAIGMIIQATAGQVLRAQAKTGKVASTQPAVNGGRSALSVIKLPDTPGADYIRADQSTDQNVSAATERVLTFSNQIELGSAFTHTGGGTVSPTNGTVTINTAGDYLFFGSVFDDNGDGVRTHYHQGWRVAGAAREIYGQTGRYHRDANDAAGYGLDYGNFSGFIGNALVATNTVEMVSTRIGAAADNNANRVALQGVRLDSLLNFTDPVITDNETLIVASSTIASITTTDLQTCDPDDLADALTYTVINAAPTGGTLKNGVATVGLGGTFTQKNIDDGDISFEAGAIGGTFGFDFSVADDSGTTPPAIGSFVIAIGAPTVVNNDTASTDEDNATTTVSPGPTVLSNDTGDLLLVTANDNPSTLGATVSVDGSGNINYDPTGSATLQALDSGDPAALDTFTYTVTDFASLETVGTVTVTVTGVNDPPTVVDESLNTPKSSAVAVNLLANDTDVDVEPLTVTTFAGGALGTVITPKGATVTVASDGSFTYDPTTSVTLGALLPGTSDSEVLAYEVTDGDATVAGSITVTTTGQAGASDDVATVDGDSTVAISALGNDNTGFSATADPSIEFHSDTASNTDAAFFNTGTGPGTLVSVPMGGPGTASVLTASPAGAPPALNSTYTLSGTGSGATHEDMAHPDFGGGDTGNATFEFVFRPSDLLGREIIWDMGGNGNGTSLCLIDNLLYFTESDGGTPDDGAQAVADLTATAGNFVHVIAQIDLTGDVVRIFVNGTQVGADVAAVQTVTGVAANITDWAGTDNGGIGRSQNTWAGADFSAGNEQFINTATMVSFAGEFSVLRIYTSLLTPAEIQSNYDSIFGTAAPATVNDVTMVDGQTVTVVGGPETFTITSGALVTLETDGSFTYDPNGVYDLLGIGQTAIDTFTYSLGTGTPAMATVEVTIDGQNPNPQVTINQAAGQSDPALTGPVVFDVVFSDAVQGFDDASTDVVLSGTAPGTLTGVIAGSGTDYTVTVSGMTGTGTVVANIPGGVAQRLVTLEDNLPGTSTDNSVTFVLNVAPTATNLFAANFVPGTPNPSDMVLLSDLVISDGNNVLDSVITTSANPVFTYDGGTGVTTFDNGDPAQGSKFVMAVPTFGNGYSYEIEFTPTAADVAVGGGVGLENRRNIFEVGGDANGNGLFLLDGVPIFLVKMNGAGAAAPGTLPDTDWNNNTSDDLVAFALSGVLTADEPAMIAVIFDLDSLRYSVNGGAEITQPLTNRAGRDNWPGDRSVSIGAAPLPGNGGGLSVTPGTWFEDDWAALDNNVTSCKWWNGSGPGFALDDFEEATVTLSLDGFVDDATSGTLSATSGNGETYSAGVWSVTGTLSAVNAALADVKYTFGSAATVPVTISITIDDGDEDGGGVLVGGASIATIVVGGTVYVDDDFSGAPGAAIADADGGTPVSPANYLIDAFTNLTDALAAIDDTSTVVVNDGDYSSDVAALSNTQTLRLTDAGDSVAIGSLDAVATNTINLQNSNLTLGDAIGSSVIDCPITGTTGTLTKTGADDLRLRGASTFTGVTTINEGRIVVTYVDATDRGSLASTGIVVTSPGILALGALVDTTYTHSNPISGTGSVSSFEDGTVIFSTPGGNTFSGEFNLGDGATSNFNGTNGNKQGFVVVNHSDDLGSGKILSRGGQLQAGTPGIVIPNDIDITGGGFRNGGSIDFSFSGQINPIGAADRGFGNYGLEGLDLTITAAGGVDTTTGRPVVEGTNAADNGSWTFDCDITGPGGFLVQNVYDGGELFLNGNNTYAGATEFRTGTTFLNGAHTGAGAYLVTGDAILAGDGSTDAPVTVAATATLSPGGSIGSLGTGNLTLAGTLVVEVDNTTGAAGTAYDQVVVTGTVDVSGGSLEVVDLKTTVEALPGEISIIANDALDAVTGTFGSEMHPMDYLGSGSGSETGYAGGTDTNDVVLNPSAALSIIGQWRFDNFGGDPTNSGPGANSNDANGNTLPNLLDFLYGFNPAGANSSGNTLEVSGGVITQHGGVTFWPDPVTGDVFMRYPRRIDYVAAGLTIVDQFSRDLILFEDAVASPVVIATGTGDDGIAVEAVEIQLPLVLPVSGGKSRFGRNAVSIAP